MTTDRDTLPPVLFFNLAACPAADPVPAGGARGSLSHVNRDT